MRANEFDNPKDTFVEMFRKFLPIAMEIIGLPSLPKIVFEKEIYSPSQPTFGQYINNEHILYVGLSNRHPNDILRTVAHELVHYKQDLLDQLNDMSGATGSPEENQANAVAGMVMRNFNKQYPEYLKTKPIIAEGLNEIDYADALDSGAISPDNIMKLGKVIGNIEGNDIVMITKGNQTVYILKVNNQATAFVGFEGKNLKNIKNFTQTTEVIRALIGYLVHKQNIKIVISPNEPLTPDGLTWLINLIKNPRGLVIKNQDGKDVDLEQLKQEWQTAKKTGIPGTTGITISESVQFGNKIRKNEESRNSGSLLMPFNFYSIQSKNLAETIHDGEESIPENFADGRNPQDKGDSARHGIRKGMTIAQLKKIRSSNSASLRKKQLAHWQINMRQGREK
jgi:hypothetical protein